MARATVELVGSASYTINQRKFIKGSPQVLTDPDEILFFQQRPGFKVKIEQDGPKANQSKKAEVKKLDKELKEIVEKPKKKKKEKPKTEPKPEPKAEKKHTKASLLALKKAELSKTAEDMGIVFDGPAKRLKIIEMILKKQEG